MELKADEMFEKIEYKKIIDPDEYFCMGNWIAYRQERKPVNQILGFDSDEKRILVNSHFLTIEELCAIYKKCEELGWTKKEE